MSVAQLSVFPQTLARRTITLIGAIAYVVLCALIFYFGLRYIVVSHMTNKAYYEINLLMRQSAENLIGPNAQTGELYFGEPYDAPSPLRTGRLKTVVYTFDYGFGGTTQTKVAPGNTRVSFQIGDVPGGVCERMRDTARKKLPIIDMRVNETNQCHSGARSNRILLTFDIHDTLK